MGNIKQKKCKCGCNLWPTIGFEGYHADHHPDPTRKQSKIDQAQARQRIRTAATNANNKLRRGISKDTLVDNEAKKKFEAQQLWFEEIKRREQPVCWETGDSFPISYMRAATAHILPKKSGIGGFPSVATHPLNYTILSPLNGSHQKYDHSWDRAQGMKIWPIVVERFKKIYPYIAQAERKYLPDCLIQELTEQEYNVPVMNMEALISSLLHHS